MATEIHFQGGSVELADSFTKVRGRLNVALKNKIDYENGEYDDNDGKKPFAPAKDLSFELAEGGRISLNPEKVICVTDDGEEADGDDE